MRILILTMSKFDGRGGIAAYNRDFIEGLSSCPGVSEVVVLPRCDRSARETISYVSSILKHLFSHRRFHLIICGHLNLSPIAYLFSKWRRVKTVLLLYGVEAWKPSKKQWRNYCACRMDFFTTISNFTKRRFTAWSKKEVSFLLPCSIKLDRFSPGKKDQKLVNQYHLTGKKVLLTLGRLDAADQYKGFDEVIDVMPELLEQYPDLIYMIAGEGTDRVRLEAKVKQLALDRSIIFTGYIAEEDKPALLRSVDLFIMPGRGEGFGIVYLEACASGIPVIGSTLDASREALLDGQLGRLVNPNHPNEIKDAIIDALKDMDRSVPEGLDYFSIDQFNKRLHRIIMECQVSPLPLREGKNR